MQVTYDSRIGIALDQLSDEQLRDLQRAFTYENPQFKKLKAMGKRFSPRKVPEYIASWKLADGKLLLPRGGIGKVRDVLGTLRIQRRVHYGNPDMKGMIPKHLLTPRSYQTKLMTAGINSLTSLWRSPPGSGKTTAAFMLASKVNLPTLVVVPTEKIFNQWIDRAKKDLGLEPFEVGIIQGSKRVIRPLTIGMQQTLKNCAGDYLEEFGCVIGDEAQRFAATTFFSVIDLFPAAYRIGVTADERRSDRKEFLIYDVFGPIDIEIDRQELIDAGAIIDAEIWVVPSDLDLPWYTKLKPLKRANPAVQDRLAAELMMNEERNELIMRVLKWCVDEGETTITMSRRREHCAALNSMAIKAGFDSGLLLGGPESKGEFERTTREMSEGTLKQAVGTYQAVGVGFDLPLVSRGIFASPCASATGRQQFEQFVGRYERPAPDKRDSVVYYIWDWKVFGENPIRYLMRWKPKVKVLWNGEWVRARDFLKEDMINEDSDQDPLFQAVR